VIILSLQEIVPMLIQSVYAESRGLESNFKPVLKRFTILLGLETPIHGMQPLTQN